MLLAIVTFGWAAWLGPGDTVAFFAICAASGIALSADLALPPSMLADAIDGGPGRVRAGTYFGLWALATKLNLALAAGIALPLVQWLGYAPGVASSASAQGARALAIVYAGVPCALKLLAVVLAWTTLRSSPRHLPASATSRAPRNHPPLEKGLVSCPPACRRD
jgi:Na+/melibiose symporter-like transporter